MTKTMKGISRCGECAYYKKTKKRCIAGASKETNAMDPFYDDCPLPDVAPARTYNPEDAKATYKHDIVLWLRGYRVQEGAVPDTYCGTYFVSSLKHAVLMWAAVNSVDIECLNIDVPSYWGCKFYDSTNVSEA